MVKNTLVEVDFLLYFNLATYLQHNNQDAKSVMQSLGFSTEDHGREYICYHTIISLLGNTVAKLGNVVSNRLL